MIFANLLPKFKVQQELIHFSFLLEGMKLSLLLLQHNLFLMTMMISLSESGS